MPFTAPTLVTSLSTSAYRTQLNANFLALQNALYQLQNELPAIIGNQSFVANLTWVERAIRADGVIGTDAFEIAFNTDGDTFEIQHNAPGGYSSCVISSRYHHTNTAYTKALSELCTGDGSYTLVFGLKTIGAPQIEQKLLVEDTDQDIDIVIWRFDCTRSGSTYTVSNLRRMCDMLMSKEAFLNTFDFYHPLTWTYTGTLPTTVGDFGTGIIVPWDCEVEGAYMHLATEPDQTDGITVDLYTGSGTDTASILDAPASWGRGESGVVKTCSPLAENTQLTAGTFIQPYLVTVESGEGTAANLSITLLLRKIYHTIL
jgi:hypothetical protein